jgi:hypothetical protein
MTKEKGQGVVDRLVCLETRKQKQATFLRQTPKNFTGGENDFRNHFGLNNM